MSDGKNGKQLALFPQTKQQLMDRLVIRKALTFNDIVHVAFREMWEDGDYGKAFRRLNEATTNKASEMGSMVGDDYEAARLMQLWAKKHGFGDIVGAKRSAVVFAMHVARKRHAMARWQLLAQEEALAKQEEANVMYGRDERSMTQEALPDTADIGAGVSDERASEMRGF